MATLYGIILCVTSVQGFSMGGYLLFYKDKKLYSNKLLALLLFVLSYVIITEALRVFGAIDYSRITYYFFLEIGWVIGPILYLYIKSLYKPGFRIGKRDIPLFIPFIIQVVISAFIKIQNLYWDGTRESLSWLGYHGYAFWMHTPVDLVVTSSLVLISIYYSYQIISQNRDRSIPLKDKSLLLILKVYCLFAVFAISICLIDYIFYDFAFRPMYVYPVYIGLGLLTYWLAFRGLLSKDQIYVKKQVSEPQLVAIMEQLKDEIKKGKYYLEPNLNVNQLSERTKIKSYMISKAINNIEGVSVSRFINDYRVNEFIERIKNPDNAHLTLLSIALDCGFNSKASANRTIKSITGKSPKELKKSLN